MTLFLLLLSAGSFVFFGLACLRSKELLSEFSRYGLSRWRAAVGCLQLLGAGGLIAGLWVPWIALVASGGLAVMMFLGICVRIKIRDSLIQTLPALFYCGLNGWLFIRLLA